MTFFWGLSICMWQIAAMLIFLAGCRTSSSMSGVDALRHDPGDAAARDTGLPLPCAGEVLLHLDGRSARLDPRNLYLTEADVIYSTALKGPTEARDLHRFRRVELAPTGFPHAPSLRYELLPCLAACDHASSEVYMQKVNHHFLYRQGRSTGLVFGERRYLGFAFMLSGDQPDHDMILFQLWQGAPFSPPFAAVTESSPQGIDVKFLIRNQATGSNPSALPIEIGRLRGVQKDSWYQFVLSASPEHARVDHRPGHHTLMVFARGPDDREFKVVAAHEGQWGYDPSDSCHYAGKCDLGRRPNTTIDFKFGLYRRGDATHVHAYYDNIRLAKTFAAARPDDRCLPADISP